MELFAILFNTPNVSRRFQKCARKVIVAEEFSWTRRVCHNSDLIEFCMGYCPEARHTHFPVHVARLTDLVSDWPARSMKVASRHVQPFF
jgi:hypothetical protein